MSKIAENELPVCVLDDCVLLTPSLLDSSLQQITLTVIASNMRCYVVLDVFVIPQYLWS